MLEEELLAEEDTEELDDTDDDELVEETEELELEDVEELEELDSELCASAGTASESVRPPVRRNAMNLFISGELERSMKV